MDDAKKKKERTVEKRNLVEDLIELEKHADFWQISRDDVLLPLVKKGPVLDIGCGTGVITRPLMRRDFDVYSVDINAKACMATKRFNPNTFCIDFTKIDQKKFPKFQSIIMADALEHIKNDMAALRKCNALLALGGRIIISVPYHNFLWTKNDVLRHHVRRYSKKELRNKLTECGFRICRLRFWNMLALGPILAAKAFHFRVPHESVSKSKINSYLKWYLTKIENKLPLPVGSALICVAEKTKSL